MAGSAAAPSVVARPARIPVWGVVSSLAAPLLLIGGWTAAAALQRDGFDPISETISALAARDADRRWVMSIALLGVGLAHLVTAFALRPASRPGRAVLALGGVATLGVAAAPLPAGGGGSATHTAFAAVAFIGLAVWPAFFVPGAREGPFRAKVAIVVSAALLAAVAWFFVELFRDGTLIGLAERVAAGGQALWPAVAVLFSRSRRESASLPLPGPPGVNRSP